jgi:hypothetical protein
LHQASRRKDAAGRVIAELADYAAVRELIADLVAEGAEIRIKAEVRETVRTVAELLADGREEVKQADIKGGLKLDKSVVSRRVAAAVDAGLLRNLEDRKGRPARLVLGDPLPEEIELLPKAERLHGCAIVGRDKHCPSADSSNGNVCAYCGQGEHAGDPLLSASIDGDCFSTHRSCLDRQWPPEGVR